MKKILKMKTNQNEYENNYYQWFEKVFDSNDKTLEH